MSQQTERLRHMNFLIPVRQGRPGAPPDKFVCRDCTDREFPSAKSLIAHVRQQRTVQTSEPDQT
jgi:hypothetical protein